MARFKHANVKSSPSLISLTTGNTGTIVKITAHTDTGNKQETETRLYISSLLDDASGFNCFIRKHWGVENNLHWTLDMVFDEDRQRKRTKNHPKIFLS